MSKVLVMLSDGMRPDSLINIPECEKMKSQSTYTLNARTVFPSMTLPCHISLFHSVTPKEHGTLTNNFVTPEKEVSGIVEVVNANKKTSALVYSWDKFKDLTKVCAPDYIYYYRESDRVDHTIEKMTSAAINFLKEDKPDFMFVYYFSPDYVGHKLGWMSDEYINAVKQSWVHMQRVMDAADDDYAIIILADHGGHEKLHGYDIDEDMTIPIFIKGKDFEKGKVLSSANIIDIAPTIADILGLEKCEDWKGQPLLKK